MLINKYPGISINLNFMDVSRQATENTYNDLTPASTFNDQQSAILSFVNYQIRYYKDNPDKYVIIQGKARTGKSCVINQMVHEINSYYNCNASLLMAFTGVAANNINDQTIHSTLRIRPQSVYAELTRETKTIFEDELKDVKFIIIHEASMLGLNLFYKIVRRLREAKPSHSDLPFGGLCVYLIGDWLQLPPIGDTSLYGKGKIIESIQASLLYAQFKKVFFLRQIMRQLGDEHKSFRETLNRISNGTITENDYKFLSLRFYINNVHDQSFKDAVCIMATNDKINLFNYNKLEETKQPVALIKAIHNCAKASKATIDDA